MTIGSLMSRMGTAEKLTIPQIQQAIKSGSLPAYVGIPLLQDKIKQEQAMRAAQAQAQAPQPSIADQVMAEADAAGVTGLPSNLPVQGMAAGGIVAFAGGGQYDDEDYDDQDAYDLAEAGAAMDAAGLSRAIMSQANPKKPAYSSLTEPIAGIASIINRTSEEAKEVKAPTKGQHKFHEKIVSEAQKLSLDPEFALKIAQKETGNLANPEAAVSPAGALGVMQLMPKTARGLGVKDPMNPEENISGGVRYAKQMLDKYGDQKLAAMAYNWGPGNVDKWLKSGKGLESLPRETRNYAAAFAEGGKVQHFYPGGLGSTGGVPINANFMNADAQLAKEARLRLMREQARAAFTPVTETAAAAETPGVMRGVASLLSRTAVPLTLASAGYGIGNAILSKKQAEELAKYGPEGAPTEAELERASKPAWMRDVSMSPKEQKERGIKPLAPLSYTPAGVDTYGPRPGYNPPGGAAGSSRGKQGGPTAEELKRADFEKAVGATQDAEDMEAGLANVASAAAANAPAAPEEKTPSSMEEYLKMLKGGYEDVKKQKEEDKYLALLAAGLGMMGGTSPFAAANIGHGALQGVSSLMEANKQRAAEKSALDKAYGQALYRQGLGEMTAANKAAELDVKRGTLALNEKREMDSVLNNMQEQAARRAQAALKTQGLIGLDTPGEEVAAKVSAWVAQDLANNRAFKDLYKQRWGYDYDVPASGGQSYAGFKLHK